MRVVYFFISSILAFGLIYILNTTVLLPAPLGKLLSPQHGLWQNAEKEDMMINEKLSFSQLKSKVNVYFDDRMVPHVFATESTDAYFVQGYLHAKFRLWQMEFQTIAAGGELSKIIGEKALPHDREFRRLGMRYAAEIALKEMEKDAETKAECDAYTSGVNEYIKSLTESTMPLEYKLIGYKPTAWTNFKTSLFLKYMSYDLAAAADDLEMTNAKSFFNKADFDLLYPTIQDSLDPIIPKGTKYPVQKIFPKAPVNADSGYFLNKDFVINEQLQPDRENGSNNWAVAGSKTRSKWPILCNDPHLSLNLPSLWYEMQISTPQFNVYGATFPGAPAVIIGFNDSCAFGFTNGGRDVRDYYEIRFKDDTRNEYLYNGVYHSTIWRVDTIKVKNSPDFIDSVAYVQLGENICPVMFDENYTGNKTNGEKNIAVRWTAHNPSNELKIFTKLNSAENYRDYLEAVTNLQTPGQNVVFAAKSGDIALRTQGDWPAKWNGQGDFIMPGIDSSFLWQGMIPQDETPYQFNPERGFVSSANQKPVAEDYPYYIGRSYPEFRGRTINKKLSQMSNISVQDMMLLQNNSYNGFAAMALPTMLKNIKLENLSTDELKYFDSLSSWNFHDDASFIAPTLFLKFWKNFADTIFNDEFSMAPKNIKRPFESTLTEIIIKDSAYKFFDNINTPQKENLKDVATAAFSKTCVDAKALSANNNILWQYFNNVSINHLARQAAFSKQAINTNGGRNAINANHGNHGPSWRMIVSLTPHTEAYGVYPGGQCGNPGSKYFDNFIPTWASGKYYKLWVMEQSESVDKRIIGSMSFN